MSIKLSTASSAAAGSKGQANSTAGMSRNSPVPLFPPPPPLRGSRNAPSWLCEVEFALTQLRGAERGELSDTALERSVRSDVEMLPQLMDSARAIIETRLNSDVIFQSDKIVIWASLLCLIFNLLPYVAI